LRTLNRERDCACLLCLSLQVALPVALFFVCFGEKTAFRAELFFDLAKYKLKKMSNELNNRKRRNESLTPVPKKNEKYEMEISCSSEICFFIVRLIAAIIIPHFASTHEVN
jgi:hypothetical protein